MNPGAIHTKTDKGRMEIAARSRALRAVPLSAVHRRVLILVDGKKTVNDLDSFVRVGELEVALLFLLKEGLIEPTHLTAEFQAPAAPGFAVADVTQAPRAATSPAEFTQVRQDTARYVLAQLGEAGEPIGEAIDRCASPAELRKLLRGVEIFIGQRLSPEITQAFARHFGSLLL